MRHWNIEVLAWALLGPGIGVLAGAALNHFVGGFAGTLAFWFALNVPVVLAFRRGDRESVAQGKSVDLGGCRSIQKKKLSLISP